MSGNNFIVEHLIRVALNCDGVSSIHISDNNAGGKLVEFVMNAGASLNKIMEVANAMHNYADAYITDDIMTIFCHVMPNGIISNKANL